MENFQQQIDDLKKEVEFLKTNKLINDHQHTGFDFSRVIWSDISTKKIYIPYTLKGADAATAANYGTIFICPIPCVVTGFKEIHQVAGSDAGAVTLTIEKLTGTTAPDSGSVILSAALSLKATANTLQNGVITSTASSRTLAIGDRICLKDAGTLTNVSNVSILIELIVL